MYNVTHTKQKTSKEWCFRIINILYRLYPITNTTKWLTVIASAYLFLKKSNGYSVTNPNTHTYIYLCIKHMYILINEYTHIYIHTYIHTHVHNIYIRTYIHTHIHTYTYIHTYIYIPIYIYTYIIYTYIHTYIHTYIVCNKW